MAFTFRPAVRENVPLLVGLSGGTGSGKTYTAMRLAHGIAGDTPFAVIDTEASRATHYADNSVRPRRSETAIHAGRYVARSPRPTGKSGHRRRFGVARVGRRRRHSGLAEAELDRMAGADWKSARRRMASRIKPKMAHKQMVQRPLQIRAPHPPFPRRTQSNGPRRARW